MSLDRKIGLYWSAIGASVSGRKFPIPASLGKAQVGYIGSMHTNTPFGWLMGHSPDAKKYTALTGDDGHACPSHSILFVRDGAGRLCVGDVTVPVSYWLPLTEFARGIQAGLYSNLRIFRVKGATVEQCEAAAAWWNSHVHNAPYDLWAFPKLIITVLFGKRFAGPDGYSWAFYCTEANGASWNIGAGLKVYPANPRPLTEIELWKQGILEEVV